jgi:hypothetical protein
MAVTITITADGLEPQDPAAIRAALITIVEGIDPGYTANLPGALIEDIASTDTYALVICDQAMVETVNSISPYSANEFVLNQLGQALGVDRDDATNTSVLIVFTGTPGFVISRGFLVTDGTHQYAVQTATIVPTGGVTGPVFCIANVAGTWSVPASSVTTLVTSAPTGIALACTNPTDGIPGGDRQSVESYRATVLRANRAAATGMPTLVKTLVGEVSGVQERLVSMRQVSGGWEVIVGGGDPYEVAFAIFQAVPDVNILAGSTDAARNETVSITDSPDSYEVVYVTPPQQDVTIALEWDTVSVNPVSEAAMGDAARQPLADYINAIVVGQPINVFEMDRVFQEAVAAIVAPELLSVIDFTVTIDAVETPPDAGTGIIQGDPEAFFFITIGDISITRAP